MQVIVTDTHIHMGMSQNEVSVFPLKVAILEAKTDTSF